MLNYKGPEFQNVTIGTEGIPKIKLMSYTEIFIGCLWLIYKKERKILKNIDRLF